MFQLSVKRCRFPPTIIDMHAKFTLSYRDIKEMLAERDVQERPRHLRLTCVTRCARPSDHWHHDEMVVTLGTAPAVPGQRLAARDPGRGRQDRQPPRCLELIREPQDERGCCTNFAGVDSSNTQFALQCEQRPVVFWASTIRR